MNGIRRLMTAALSLVLLALSLVLAANIALLASRGTGRPTVLGFSWAVVLSGSMEPAISLDDLVIAREQADYAVGDVVIYQKGASLITHRIVAREAGGFVTQGDANNAPDAETVSAEEIVGRVLCSVPRVGQLVGFLRTPAGMACAMALAALLLLLSRTKDP